jgi:cytochrome c oxidase assembly protein subunit 19
MSSMTFGQKTFTPTPPDKGSFPLDHEGQCRKEMVKYMVCLRTNKNNSSACREEAMSYLDCRMNNQLMAKEDWSKLGFGDLATSVKSEK